MSFGSLSNTPCHHVKSIFHSQLSVSHFQWTWENTDLNFTIKPNRTNSRKHLYGLLLICVVPLSSCITLPKKSAHLTEIHERRSIASKFPARVQLANSTSPQFLNYSELTQLARNHQPAGALGRKLDRLWRTPIVSNQAWKSGLLPTRASNPYLGEFLRIGTWNVEKSLRIADVADALSSESDYLKLMHSNPLEFVRRKEMLRQRQRLADSDILLFQEMDIGVDRSDYHHSPELLAEKLGMNYAYAPKQIELEPVLQNLESSDNDSLPQLDTDRYRGLFGLLVLSKYPIKSATAFPLKHQPYDWYGQEFNNHDTVEGVRRISSKGIFDNTIEREVKVGGRIFFRVDLEVPGLPNNTLSIINVHLEIRAQAEDRREQLEEILSHIKDIPHPVILAGDFNSSRYDLSPTSLPRVISRGARNPNVWIFGGVNLLFPAQAIYNTGRTAFNGIKNLYNPLASHNPVIAPNKTAEMFEMVEDYRFSDGGKFDFRGTPERSISGSDALLANSNEKALKGYRPTFSVNRPIGPFGRHRLDWIFVKSNHLTDQSESFRFAPHFGETITAFEKPMKSRLSDHRPSVVDLPLGETNLSK